MQSASPTSIANAVAAASPIFSFSQASGTASVAEEPIGAVGPGPETIPIGAIILHPLANLALSGSAYIAVNVYKRTGGGSQQLIGTATTFTGGTALAALTPLSMTLQTGAGSFLSPGDTLTMAITNTGSAAQPQFTVSGYQKAN